MKKQEIASSIVRMWKIYHLGPGCSFCMSFMSGVFSIKTLMSTIIMNAMKLAVQSHLFTLLAYGKLRNLIDSEMTNRYKKYQNNGNMKKCKNILTLGRWVGSMYLYNLPMEGKPKFLYGSLNKEGYKLSISLQSYQYDFSKDRWQQWVKNIIYQRTLSWCTSKLSWLNIKDIYGN